MPVPSAVFSYLTVISGQGVLLSRRVMHYSELPKWGVRVPLQILLWSLVVFTMVRLFGYPHL